MYFVIVFFVFNRVYHCSLVENLWSRYFRLVFHSDFLSWGKYAKLRYLMIIIHTDTYKMLKLFQTEEEEKKIAATHIFLLPCTSVAEQFKMSFAFKRNWFRIVWLGKWYCFVIRERREYQNNFAPKTSMCASGMCWCYGSGVKGGKNGTVEVTSIISKLVEIFIYTIFVLMCN